MMDEDDGEQQAEQDKALAIYSDNLPYDRNRIIEETKFFLKHEVVAKYEAGKRLILLREQEGVQTFAQILGKNFPGLSRRHAYNYISFAQKITQLPKIRDFAEGEGNFSKCLALLESLDEDELAALEAGEPIAGKTLDEIDKMTVRELKKALRKEKEKNQPLTEQVAALDKEKRDMAEELSEVKQGKRSPERYWEDFKRADEHITAAVMIIRGLPKEVLREDITLLAKVGSLVGAMEIMVENLNIQINANLENE